MFLQFSPSTSSSSGQKRRPSYPAPEWLEDRIAPAVATINVTALGGDNGFQITGPAGVALGRTVSEAGDINADGIDDFLVGAPGPPFGTNPAFMYVVFGTTSGFANSLHVSSLNGLNGFTISSPVFDGLGFVGTAVGDVNGDSIDDILLGTQFADTNGTDSGAAYVIYGKTSAFASTMALSSLNGSNGFTIVGASASQNLGNSASAAGDVNGDGRNDFIISRYVIFGRSDFPATFNVQQIDGNNGFSVSGSAYTAGDVNGDGFDDVLVGATVFYGSSQAFPAVVNSSTLGNLRTFSISGASASGRSVGDFNNDGFDDIILPASVPDVAYVVFGEAGRTGALNVSTLNGSNGVLINGLTSGQAQGTLVSEAGDFNDDGFDDAFITLGNPTTSTGGYIIFGKPSGTAPTISVASLNGVDGITLVGIGGGVLQQSRAGDVNGDGRGDILLGNFGAYVIYGIQSAGGFLSISDATVTEGNDGTTTAKFTVSLAQAATETVTVGYSTAQGTATTADFEAFTSASLSFAPGETSKVIEVLISGDLLIESNETFTVILSNPTNGIIIDDRGTGTIQNDDNPTITIEDVSITEGNAPKNAVFTVVLSTAHVLPVTVRYTTSNGTATAPSDYTAQTGVLLTIPAGSTSKTFSIPIIGNTTVEPDETFSVILSDANNAVITDDTAIGTILNEDFPSISVGDVSIAEGTSETGTTLATVTVTLSVAPFVPLSVMYATSAGTAGSEDFVSISSTLLTFEPGEMSKTFTVEFVPDSKPEANETFFVQLSNASNGQISDGTAQITIGNDDQPLVSISNASVTEGNSGRQALSFSVSLSQAHGLPVTIGFQALNGNALEGIDFFSPLAKTVQFAPGETTKQIAFEVSGDLAIEMDENFTVQLTNPVNAIIAPNGGTGTGTIQGDDLPGLSISNVTIAESESVATFLITLSEAYFSPVSVSYTTENRTAMAGSDFTAAFGELIFAPGETQKSVSVSILNDSDIEDHEVFALLLANAANATITDSEGIGTLSNDDHPNIAINDTSVLEGNSDFSVLAFTVALSEPHLFPVTISFQTADGSALAPNDYTPLASGTLTFAPGETSKTISVMVTGETSFESNENLEARLFNANNANISDSLGVGTILNDDLMPLISIGNTSIQEPNEGSSLAQFAISLSATSSFPISVDYFTRNGHAKAPSDYTPLARTSITFAPGETTKSISIEVLGDINFEPDETFEVHLANSFGGTLSDSFGVATIQNNDAAPSTVLLLDGNSAVKFFDSDGDLVTIRLSGAGSGEVFLEGGVGNNADIASIQLTGTTFDKSKLQVTTKRFRGVGGGQTNIGELLVDGGLKAFTTKGNIIGAGIVASDAIGSIQFHDLIGGVIETGGSTDTRLKLNTHDIGQFSNIKTTSAIHSFHATKILDAEIEATELGRLLVQSSIHADINISGPIGTIAAQGNVEGDWTAQSVRNVLVTNGTLSADITSQGALSKTQVRGGGLSANLVALHFGTITVEGGDIGGSIRSTSNTSIQTSGVGSLSIRGGSLIGDIDTEGSIRKLSIVGGDLAGAHQAGSFGHISVKDGDFVGSLTTFPPTGSLGSALALNSISINRGDISGDIRLIGSAGKLTVKGSRTGLGGNVIDSSIVAADFSSISVTGNIVDSKILAGADLGSDFSLGGGDDHFASGTIGKIRIGGDVTGASVIAAGIATANNTLKDGDDSIAGGIASVLRSLIISGTVGSESYFAAGLFMTAPKIGGISIVPSEDLRFRTAQT